MKLPLILASSSPRRKQLLTLLDRSFESHDHKFDEDKIPNELQLLKFHNI
jgi:predicted house-cleaning NTP pyrophosphatase (Maf/HAM1 superfamily)